MGVASDMYQGSGAKPVSWEEVGQTIEGEIEGIRVKQLPQFGTDKPEVWADGEAKMTPILTLATGLGNDGDEEDDGRRDVYLRSNAYTAFSKALREAFPVKPDDSDLIGCTIKLQFHATEKSGKGAPRKLFRCRITRKSATADAWADEPKTEAPPKPASTRPSGMPPASQTGGPPDDDLIPF